MMRLSSETVIPMLNPEEKEFLWEEDAMQPVIVKFDQLAYDVCQGEQVYLGSVALFYSEIIVKPLTSSFHSKTSDFIE